MGLRRIYEKIADIKKKHTFSKGKTLAKQIESDFNNWIKGKGDEYTKQNTSDSFPFQGETHENFPKNMDGNVDPIANIDPIGGIFPSIPLALPK